jgi:hypothetical protein
LNELVPMLAWRNSNGEGKLLSWSSDVTSRRSFGLWLKGEEVGMRLAKTNLGRISIFAPGRNAHVNTGEKSGGDDETRTRDLCRDRVEVEYWFNTKSVAYESYSRLELAQIGLPGTVCSMKCSMNSAMPRRGRTGAM